MKNAKLISLGLAFAVVSLTSIQISAMEPEEYQRMEPQLQAIARQQQLWRQEAQAREQAQNQPLAQAARARAQEERQAHQAELQARTQATQAREQEHAARIREQEAQAKAQYQAQQARYQEEDAQRKAGAIQKKYSDIQPILQPLRQEFTEAIKMLADKITALDQAVKAMQIDLVTLKEIVIRDHSTAIRRLNEAIENRK